MRVICYYVKFLFFFSIYIFVSSPEGDLTAIVIKVGSINYHRKKFNINGSDFLSSF